MKAVYKYAPGAGTTRLEERPIPQITQLDNVRVKVSACSVCGMDVHMFHGKFPCNPPFIMGHEFVGVVETVATGVASVAVGDRVVAQPHLYSCGHCQICQDGFPQYCKDKRSIGINRDGAMTDYVIVPDKYLHKIPDSIPDTLACLLEPMTILVSDVIVYPQLKPGETVAIIGAGQIAQLGVVAAKAGGAGTVIVSGAANDLPMRLPAAKALGADYVFNCQETDVIAKIMEITAGRGVDMVVEASGAEAGINTGIACLRTGGRMTVLGGTKKDSVAINWDAALKKMLSFQFHMMSDYEAMDKAIEIFANYPFDLSPLVTQVAPLEDWERIFNLLSHGEGIKAVLTIGG